MRFAALALLLAVPALAAQDNEAEKLYRQLEKKLTDAKAYRAVGELEVPDGGGKCKFTLNSAGDRFRVDVHGMEGEEAVRTMLICDGTRIRIISSPRADRKDFPAPKNFGRLVSKLLARGGGVAMELPRPAEKDDKEIDADEVLSVRNIKMGEPTKLGGRDAKVIRYTITPEKHAVGTFDVALWLDAKTNLPLKHVITSPDQERGFTTTYTSFEIDPKVDPKIFEIPK